MFRDAHQDLAKIGGLDTVPGTAVVVVGSECIKKKNFILLSVVDQSNACARVLVDTIHVY